MYSRQKTAAFWSPTTHVVHFLHSVSSQRKTLRIEMSDRPHNTGREQGGSATYQHGDVGRTYLWASCAQQRPLPKQRRSCSSRQRADVYTHHHHSDALEKFRLTAPHTRISASFLVPLTRSLKAGGLQSRAPTASTRQFKQAARGWPRSFRASTDPGR